MLINISLLCLGILLLYIGSEWMVKGAGSLALLFSIRPVIVGLTVVAFATSAPELLVSLVAAIMGSSGISLGNILGSNVANISLVLGSSALVTPLAVGKGLIRREFPYMIGVSVLFWILCLDGYVGRGDGIILLLLLGVFLAMGILTARRGEKKGVDVPRAESSRVSWLVFLVVIGAAGLIVGAHLIVDSAVFIARRLGFSEVFIGLSIVAVGTSLPELAASVVAGARSEPDISIGNVIGSNVFNVCMVIGTVGLFNPMSIERGVLVFEFPAMVFLSLLLFVFARTGFTLGRAEGFVLLLGFFFFVGVSYLLN